MQFTTHAQSETMALAATLALAIEDSTVISLDGTLGAGKSVFVRGFAMGLGIDPDLVTSPTFTLWQTYQGSKTLHHLDAYRLSDVNEFYDIGAEELFEMGGVVMIEWGQRIAEALPRDYLTIQLQVIDQTTRWIELIAAGNFQLPNITFTR
jgi:tRNA threonylcarbamoyladenosine biosynthesis protein TsaE